MIDGRLTSFELFAGAGGLALGAELAGFQSLGIVEWDKWACETVRDNRRNAHPLVSGWAVHEGDVRDFPWSSIEENVDLLAGGPPCQPFSLRGAARAHADNRDMFPAMISAVRALTPRAFIVENVEGLLRKQFSDYFRYILLCLEFPERVAREGETWFDHLSRLAREKEKTNPSASELTYTVTSTLVNAADYGVPQKRERVFIVGFRSDLEVSWSFPSPTHSWDALLYAQRRDGEYWSWHGLPSPSRCPEIEKPNGEMLPWRTVRDALSGLPEAKMSDTGEVFNHVLKPGAKIYPGHTGSALDAPSKTLKAGVHGVPGGENMLIDDEGRPRYCTVREAARIQTFPDGYRLNGAWSEAMRQLGNAVPVKLAQVVASSVSEALIESEMKRVSDDLRLAAQGAR